MDRPGSGLRRLIGLLLALNLGVLVFGWGLGYWRNQTGQPMTFNADKIRLVSELRPDNPTRANPQAAAQAVPEAVKAVPVPNCVAWSGLDADELARVEASLKEAGITTAQYDLTLAKKLGWWVFIPPMADAEALRAVMEALRQKGVTDLAVVRGGTMANAVSLGAFPSLARARIHAALMTGKEIEGVRYGPRLGSGEVRLILNNAVPAERRKKLAGLWPSSLVPGACAGE